MQLEKLKVSKLHGYINEELEFKEDLALLVGINGSGKTSILNAIDWVLRFDIGSLCVNSFELIELTFKHKKKTFMLRATQSSSQLKLETVSDEEKIPPITVDFLTHPSKFGNVLMSNERENMLKLYSGLSPEKHERPLWNLFKKLEKPVVITLDRVLSVEDSSGAFFLENREALRKGEYRLGEPLAPITKVKQVTTEHFSRYRTTVEKLNEQLKAKIVMSAFRDPLDSARKATRQLTEEEVNRLEKKITDLVSPSTKGAKESTQISSYFGHAKKYLASQNRTSSKDASIISKVFTTQFQQIEALAEAFDRFEQDSAKEFEYLNRYLKSINRFFSDSGKELTFNDISNTLTFRSTSTGNVASSENRDIAILSSGERQILVLFTFLAFIAKEDSVFIIDEPELSLHPKWQSDFLAAFLELKPTGTQLLLATHSPEIVANHKDRCIILKAKR